MKANRSSISLLLALALVAMAGCGPAPTATPTAAPVLPTDTTLPTAIPPTNTPVPTDTPIPTITPTPGPVSVKDSFDSRDNSLWPTCEKCAWSNGQLFLGQIGRAHV